MAQDRLRGWIWGTVAALVLCAAVFCALVDTGAGDDLPPLSPAQWPKTKDAAVDLLLHTLPLHAKIQIATTPKDDLISYHFGLGMFIRNEYGLWGGNRSLMQSCNADDPDSASGVIIDHLWFRLWVQAVEATAFLISLLVAAKAFWNRSRRGRHRSGNSPNAVQPETAF